MSEFKYRFQEALKKRNKTSAEICRATGISSARISQYRTGVYVPKIDAVYTIAAALDVDPEWLVGKGDTMDVYPRYHTEQDLSPFEMRLLNSFQLADDYVKRAICCLLKIEANGSKIEDVRTFSEEEIQEFGDKFT